MTGATHEWITGEQAAAFYRQAQETHVSFEEAFPEG
jgi:hypothetical protein